MKIAFYAPLKSPEHPVPSGDRLMARLLMTALRRGGHAVSLASELRSFHASPQTLLPDLHLQARAEIDRLSGIYEAEGAPEVWFCYHPYYKAPDLLGPTLCARFGMAMVTVEASWSQRRNIGIWAEHQAALLETVTMADLNICLTQRDFDGLRGAASRARLARLSPFIEAERFLSRAPAPQPGRLVTVAMMREGDKLSSYRALAAALARIPDRDFELHVAGDGPCRAEVEALFKDFPPETIVFLGRQDPDDLAALLSTAALYVWPGHGEAYGLAYLEAAAAGVPVVAENIAGVPEVVHNGLTGLLTPPGDSHAYAKAISGLLRARDQRESLGAAARKTVRDRHSLAAAAERLNRLLADLVTLRGTETLEKRSKE